MPIKGNKKRAEEMLLEARRTFIPNESTSVDDEMLFSDYLEYWLGIAKSTITLSTYSSYATLMKGSITPYFKERKKTLAELTPKDIQDYYTEQLKRVKASTVIHYHAIIHRALKYAYKTGMITENPAAKIDRPKKEKFIGEFYDEVEMEKLLMVASGTKIELPICFAAFYGLRRSEVLGLKWDCFDFQRNTLTICHTVVDCTVDGKTVTVASDRTKTNSSMRTLPLVPMFRESLL